MALLFFGGIAEKSLVTNIGFSNPTGTETVQLEIECYSFPESLYPDCEMQDRGFKPHNLSSEQFLFAAPETSLRALRLCVLQS